MEQVVELHLFPPIRQGGVETGVAVVAETPREPGLEIGDPREVAVDVAEERDAAGEADTPSDAVDDAVLAASDEMDGDVEIAADREVDVEADADVMVGAADVAPVRVAAARLIIHVARYRLTLKGVDRGKWEVDVHAEADASLEALDAVIRGVQRRTGGEGAEPDRLSTDALREALDAPLASLER
jgi:hypothetical protein